MKWAIANGWRQDNPADAIAQALPKQGDTQKHRKSLPYDKVPEFLDALKASDAGQATKLALELVILTASRSGEVRLAEWSEIDLAEAVWTRPAHRMKSKKEHRVPLSPRAVELLKEAAKLGSGEGLVFPGTVHGKPLSDMTLSKLTKALGYDVDVHGFRTSFKTWTQERTNTARDVSEVGGISSRAYAGKAGSLLALREASLSLLTKVSGSCNEEAENVSDWLHSRWAQVAAASKALPPTSLLCIIPFT